jgi:uncharacterized pyridoxamine 5'-phosphate oxidase family protein
MASVTEKYVFTKEFKRYKMGKNDWEVRTMSRIVDVLKQAGVFYIGTMEDDQPRVRPFGAVIEYEGKIYFCTGNRKDVFNQLMRNPKTEICGSLPDGRWVRVAGTLARDDNDAVRAAMLEAVPMLKKMYSVGDGLFEVLRLDNAVATLYSMRGAPEALID